MIIVREREKEQSMVLFRCQTMLSVMNKILNPFLKRTFILRNTFTDNNNIGAGVSFLPENTDKTAAQRK